MKIAISGKGGVGKSTVAAVLALMLADRGDTVLALDADPDANLASALGVGEAEQRGIVSIAEQIDLIEERTGAKVGTYGQMFNLNPDVADVAARFARVHRGVSLLVLGAAQKGGGGCACPENTFVRALVSDLVLRKDEALIMDMEAGIEHLGRGTASGVDVLLVVVEPGQRSLDCALQVERMAHEIGLDNLVFVGNKVAGLEDEEWLEKNLQGRELAACLPFSESVRRADRDGESPYDHLDGRERALYAQILSRIER